MRAFLHKNEQKSYFCICEYCCEKIRSYTVAPFSTAALRTSLPMRPKPLIPIFPAGMIVLDRDSFATDWSLYAGRCKLSPEWCPLSDFHETQGWQLTSRHQTWEMYFSPSGCCCLNVWNSNLPDFNHVICLNLENSHGTGEKQLNR